MEVYLYILGACPNPDRIPENCVPFKIDKEFIFFGREKDISKQEIYMAGFNASNPRRFMTEEIS